MWLAGGRKDVLGDWKLPIENGGGGNGLPRYS